MLFITILFVCFYLCYLVWKLYVTPKYYISNGFYWDKEFEPCCPKCMHPIDYVKTEFASPINGIVTSHIYYCNKHEKNFDVHISKEDLIKKVKAEKAPDPTTAPVVNTQGEVVGVQGISTTPKFTSFRKKYAGAS